MKRRLTYIMVCLLLTQFNLVFADWTSVAPGIDYQQFLTYVPPGPTNVYVTRMHRDSTNCVIDTILAQGRLNKTGLASGREVLSSMVNRYQDTINYWGSTTSYVQYWGPRTQIVAAINGDYFNPTTGVPSGGQIIGGWFAKRFPEYGGNSGFFWKLNRTCYLGGNVRNGDAPSVFEQLVSFGGNSATITKLNTTRSTNDLVLYTPQYGPYTYTDNNGTEVLVQMVQPNLSFPQRTWFALGTVSQIRPNAGSTPIPFDSVVFSGHGTAASYLNSQCTVGQEVRVYMHIKDWGISTSEKWNIPAPLPYDQDWGKVYASIGGAVYIVVSSKPWFDNWSETQYTIRRPRTAVAFNSSYLYFVVVDGDRPGTNEGMLFTELAKFCVDTLQAEFAIAQDGGGSSELWVNGQVKNNPSDGTERAVANGYVMAIILPMSKTSTYSTGDKVMAKTNAEVRLGPGTNYAVIATAPSGITGRIVSHSINGIYATGKNWWKWKFADTEGWTAEENLEYVPAGKINDWKKY
ncbi:MAG: phosphodiester glycosidase family protein [bacterium]|nr:phosphodiester glycosidase family protein [bacterium]